MRGRARLRVRVRVGVRLTSSAGVKVRARRRVRVRATARARATAMARDREICMCPWTCAACRATLKANAKIGTTHEALSLCTEHDLTHLQLVTTNGGIQQDLHVSQALTPDAVREGAHMRRWMHACQG